MACGWCRQEGHNRQTCQHYADYLTALDDTIVECGYCGETGHEENQCQHLHTPANHNDEYSYMHDNAVSTLADMHTWTQDLHIDTTIDPEVNADFTIDLRNETPSREPSYSPTHIAISTPPRNRHPIGNPPNAPIRSRTNRDIFSHPPLTRTLVTCVENPFPRQDCPICMDDIKKTDSFTTRCGHMFHGTCMLQHMRHNTDCPCCRGVLVA